MSARERLAEIARLEEQAVSLGLAEQLADNFARMRRKAVSTGSAWDKDEGGLMSP